MSHSINIILISNPAFSTDWIQDHVDALRGPFPISLEVLASANLPFVPDLLIVDSSFGYEQARSLMSDILMNHPRIPILVSLTDGEIEQWDHLVRHGAQDFVLTDSDSSSSFRRTIVNALDRSAILHSTQEAETRLRTVIENISDGVLIIDSTGIIIFANPAAEFMLGRSLTELYGLKTPVETKSLKPEFVRIEHVLGEALTLLVTPSPITWEGQSGILLNMRDVTAEHKSRSLLEAAREKAQKAEDMKSAFLANMSHELRLPLASIIGFAQLIEEGTDNPDFTEFAEVIQESGNRLLHTINSVLEATRLDQHTIHPEVGPVLVRDIADEVLRSLSSLMVGSDVVLSADGPAHIQAQADSAFLSRILTNLIGNAIKFTSKGSILLKWKQTQDVVTVSVSDTGIGIDQAFLTDVFRPFTQESSGPGRTHEGTGLGLSITKGLVESMEGLIQVSSEKGKGSTFTFTLPAVQAQ